MRSIGKLLASVQINYHRLTVASRCCPAEAFASVVPFERSKSLKRPCHSAGAAVTCELYSFDSLVQPSHQHSLEAFIIFISLVTHGHSMISISPH